MKRVGTLLGIAVLATGCGGGSAAFAGMSEDEAMLEAHNAAAYEVNSPSSDVYRGRPTLSRLVQSSNRAGGEAWLAFFEQQEGPSLCIWIWTDDSPLGGRINTEVGDCAAAEKDLDDETPA